MTAAGWPTASALLTRAGFTKHVSLTTPSSLCEEADDLPDVAAAAAGLRRSLTTDDAILTSHLYQPIIAAAAAAAAADDDL